MEHFWVQLLRDNELSKVLTLTKILKLLFKSDLAKRQHKVTLILAGLINTLTKLSTQKK